MEVAAAASLAAATGLASSGPARAQDSMKALLTPIPPQAPATEGIADLGDAKLWFWDTGGSGEAVVFLHPNSGSHEFYPYQQPAFAKAGYRAISYSRRGRYQSEAGENPRESIPADDIVKLMKHLKVEKFHLVGNAAGGSIALDVAISHPDRVLSLVIACSIMGIAEQSYSDMSTGLRPKGFAELPIEVKEIGPSYRVANPAGVAEWKKRHERAGPAGPNRLKNRITWQALAELKMPTLLLTSDADLWMPPYLLRLVAQKMPGAKVVIVADAGHAVQWEQPDAFNGAILDFIRGKAR
jgi:pimeloyl-ACP methyl ester carboxylesterase